MNKPRANLQLVYVKEIEKSVAFYKQLFAADPVFETPRYVAFSTGGDGLFAVWNGGLAPDPAVPRFSEVGITVPKNEDVQALFEKWNAEMKLDIVMKPTEEIFGLTFMIKDPDGHLIRVSPVD